MGQEIEKSRALLGRTHYLERAGCELERIIWNGCGLDGDLGERRKREYSGGDNQERF